MYSKTCSTRAYRVGGISGGGGGMGGVVRGFYGMKVYMAHTGMNIMTII